MPEVTGTALFLWKTAGEEAFVFGDADLAERVWLSEVIKRYPGDVRCLSKELSVLLFRGIV